MLRAKKTSKKLAQESGRRGGRKRARNLTPQQRREIAIKAATARWAKPQPEQTT